MSLYTIVHDENLRVIACNNPIVDINASLGSVPADWSSGKWADHIQTEFRRCLAEGGFVVPRRQLLVEGAQYWYRLRLDRVETESQSLVVSTAALLPEAITSLSPAEWEVFNLAVTHFADRNKIASELQRSPETVKTHIRHICEKLGVEHTEFLVLISKLPR